MIVRVSIAPHRQNFHWLIQRIERHPQAPASERYAFEILAEGTASSREAAATDCVRALDRVAPGAPIEGTEAAERPVVVPGYPRADRRWSVVFMSDKAEALARCAALDAGGGTAPRAYTQEDTGFLWSARPDGTLQAWPVIGRTDTTVTIARMGSYGALDPIGDTLRVQIEPLLRRGHTKEHGRRFLVRAEMERQTGRAVSPRIKATA